MARKLDRVSLITVWPVSAYHAESWTLTNMALPCALAVGHTFFLVQLYRIIYFVRFVVLRVHVVLISMSSIVTLHLGLDLYMLSQLEPAPLCRQAIWLSLVIGDLVSDLESRPSLTLTSTISMNPSTSGSTTTVYRRSPVIEHDEMTICTSVVITPTSHFELAA